MLRFLLTRLAATVPVLVTVGIVVFLILRLTPGDPAAVMAGNNATLEDIAKIRNDLGLDKSLFTQFGLWVKSLASGDLGYSYFYKLPVSQLIADRIGPTLSLATFTILLAVAVAVPLGTLAAWKHGSWLDKGLMGFSVLGFSVPVFVLAYCLIWLLSIKLNIFPVQGYKRIGEYGVAQWLLHLALPALTLSIVYVALIARVTRAAVSEALTEDYVRTARAKGLPEWKVLYSHGLANAAVPIVTVIGIGVALLIGGVVVTETVYAIPGLGQLTVDAVLARDFPIVQGVILLFSVTYVLINLLVDLSYLFFDPRIRY